MKRATAVLGVVAMSLWATTAFAQGRNFGGNWTIDTEKTAASGGAFGGGTMVARGGGGGGGGRGGAVAAGGTGGTITAVGGGGAAVRTAGAGGGGGRGGGMASGPMTVALDTTSFTFGAQTYKIDGTTTRESPVGTVTAKAAWKADKLVIEETSQGANGPTVTTISYYLEGDSLVRETSRPAPDGGDPRVSKTFFKRS